MNYAGLKDEISNGPLAAECAAEGTDEGIAALLNRADTQHAVETWINARTLLAELGASMGATILDKLEAAAGQSSPVKWMMKFLCTDTGIDIGHPNTQGQIDTLVTAGVLTEAEGTALKNMAVKECSRAQIVGLGTVSPGDVSIALRGGY